MRFLKTLALAAIALAYGAPAFAEGTISDLPRKETLIVENPEGTIKNPGWFNIWAGNGGGTSTGLQQGAMDTFWYIDPDFGIDGVWDNSLASEKPIYNADFTEMTVKLRKGIYWSDGVEFTADDVIYTIDTHMKTKGLRYSAQVQINVEFHREERRLHRRVPSQEAELPIPRVVHRALHGTVDDAQAYFRG